MEMKFGMTNSLDNFLIAFNSMFPDERKNTNELMELVQNKVDSLDKTDYIYTSSKNGLTVKFIFDYDHDDFHFQGGCVVRYKNYIVMKTGVVKEKFVVVRKSDDDLDCDSLDACSFEDKAEAVTYAMLRAEKEIRKIFDRSHEYHMYIDGDSFIIEDLDIQEKIFYIIVPEIDSSKIIKKIADIK